MGKRKTKNTEKKKIKLVFDESKRKEFLCGFRKRKLERKKKAKEEMERMLKEEKKRIRQENKESYKKLVVSSRPIPDIEQLLQEEYEDEDVNVKIVELSADTLQKKDIVIGDNKPKQSVDKVINTKKKKELPQNVPGMGSDEESVDEASEADADVIDTNETKLKTKKEVKQMLKRQATKKIQKSKVFQMKSKLDRIQNKKKSQQKKGHMAKIKKTDSKKNKTRKKSHKKKQVK
ncbi:nucleolar protein 12 [Papilio machaon]|uniref:nucleolar protein 12 n=1 Tax=Papilio machaon TaxID=76193 RepID=UPI001E6639E7|nr:nucleolar protein 12 [Papilio machaon]